MALITCKNLSFAYENQLVIDNLSFEVKTGEYLCIVGENGAGKSTLSAVLAGKPQFTVTAGSIEFLGQDLLAMSPEERAWAGIFLSFQYPVEIPGVTMANFMKIAVNEQRKYKGLEPLTAAQFLKMMREKAKVVKCKAWHENDVLPVQTAAGITKTMAPRTPETIEKFPLEVIEVQWADYYNNIYDCLRNGAKPLITHAQQVRLMRLMEAIFESAEKNTVISFE